MEEMIIKINWKGPYELDGIKKLKQGNGLYLLTGKQKYQREGSLLYCGITKNDYINRFQKHDAIEKINKELQIWLGQISQPQAIERLHLELAESIIIYFWKPDLNTRKKINPPNKPITIISNWFKGITDKNGKDIPRINQKNIYRELHDVLSWDGIYWRTGNLKVYTDDWQWE